MRLISQKLPNKKIYSVGDGVPEYLSFLGEEDQITEWLRRKCRTHRQRDWNYLRKHP